MIGFAIGVVIGLLLGWIVLPEPAFVRRFFVRIGWAKPAIVPITPATYGDR